ncbi:CYTH domain-containing protein [Candidatus Bathyarchaeota archaeon]|nr:CYTH domain-containing protein [Candidatus Bathyarchaeota archaeon]
MEIERKFVLRSVPEGVHSGREVVQGYLWFEPEVRLRTTGGEHRLTIKSTGGLSRDETEHPIPEAFFSLLWPLVGSNVVRKTRYLLDYNELVLEVDVFSGRHEGLVVLECEFKTVEEAERFQLPGWIGPATDVTHDSRFKNRALSKSGKGPDL